MGRCGSAWPASRRRRGSKDHRQPQSGLPWAAGSFSIPARQPGWPPLSPAHGLCRPGPAGFPRSRGRAGSAPFHPCAAGAPPSILFPPVDSSPALPFLITLHNIARPTSQGPAWCVVLRVQNIPQHCRSVPHLRSAHGCAWVCMTHAGLHHPCRFALPTQVCNTHVHPHHPREFALPMRVCIACTDSHRPHGSASLTWVCITHTVLHHSCRFASPTCCTLS